MIFGEKLPVNMTIIDFVCNDDQLRKLSNDDLIFGACFKDALLDMNATPESFLKKAVIYQSAAIELLKNCLT